MNYACGLCNKEHESRTTLQFLFTTSVLADAPEEPKQFNWVVCQEVCADKVRYDAETAEVHVDEPFAG